MAYQQPFLRLVAAGTIYSGDTFSFSMSLIKGSGAVTVPTEVPPAVISAFTSYWNTSSLISQYAKLTTLKLNQIGLDGRYTEPTTVRYDYPPPGIPGSSTGTNTAPQIALAISLTTAISRGRAHAGRFYLPLPAMQPGVDGRITMAQAITALNASVLFVKALNTAMAPWVVGVTSNIGVGAQQAVTGMRVGRVLDTIRSRRSGFLEEHQALPL